MERLKFFYTVIRMRHLDRSNQTNYLGRSLTCDNFKQTLNDWGAFQNLDGND